jgi:hypothetical protein
MSGFMLQGDTKGSQLRLPPQPNMPVLACAAGDFFLPPPSFRDLSMVQAGTARLVARSQPDARRCSYNCVSIFLSLCIDSLL